MKKTLYTIWLIIGIPLASLSLFLFYAILFDIDLNPHFKQIEDTLLEHGMMKENYNSPVIKDFESSND